MYLSAFHTMPRFFRLLLCVQQKPWFSPLWPLLSVYYVVIYNLPTVLFHSIQFCSTLSHRYHPFSPQHKNCILLLFYNYSSFVLWFHHWELIFPFINTNCNTERSYLKHVFNVAAVVIFLDYYFKLNSVAFSYSSLFLNHLFTSTDSFLLCRCLDNPLFCCVINLYKPLQVGRFNATNARDHHSSCDTSHTANPLTPLNLRLLFPSRCWHTYMESLLSSCKKHLPCRWSMVCLSIAWSLSSVQYGRFPRPLFCGSSGEV